MKGFYNFNHVEIRVPGIRVLKGMFLFTFLVLMGQTGFGQTYVNNTASVSGGNAFPFNSNATTPSQNFVELSFAPGDWSTTPKSGLIKTVYFRFTTVNSTTYSNLTISLAQLAATSITATTTFTTPVTVCYGPTTTTINPSASGVWVPIKLTKPFLYNPANPLIIQIQHNSQSGSGNTIGTTTGSILARYRIWGTYGSTSGSGNDKVKYDFGFDVAPAGSNNAGVTQLISPVAFCPGTYGIQVRASDLGINDLTTVSVGWTFDGASQTGLTWNYTIPAGHDTILTLGTKTFVAGTIHKLKAWTYNPNNVKDTTPGDDTLFVNTLTPAISGTFTINPSGGSGGTNFTSFTSAVSFLNANGICGPVLFKVLPGTYNEQVNLGVIAGSSSTNTITFDGGDSTKTILTFNGSTNPATFNIAGSSYIILKHLGIYTQSTSGNFAVRMTSGASYNTVMGCIIMADTNTTNTVTALGICGTTYSTSDGSHHNTVINNIIKGGYATVSCYGAGSSTPNAGNQIIHNYISRGYLYSLYFLYQSGYLISRNSMITRPNSGVSSYGLLNEYCNAGTVDGNIISANYMNYLYYADYYVTGGTTYFTNNVIYGQYYSSGGYTLYAYYNGNTKIYHNIFYNTLPTSGYCLYLYGQGSNNFDVRDNIIVRAGSNAIYAVYSSTAGYITKFDYNDFWGVTGGNFALVGSTYSDLPSMQKGLVLTPAIANNNSLFADPGFASTTTGTENFRMCTTCYGQTGIYVGVDFDADGKSRCKLFPNMGAYETNNGKGKPNVKFFVTSNIYPGSPSYVYQTYKPGSPTSSHWYLNGVKVSDSTVLLTNKFQVGSNTLKLVVQTCGGTDSFTQSFNVAAPTAVPVTDFVANKNAVVTADVVRFQDLSTNGPQTWTWSISSDSTVSNGTKVPTYKFVFPGTYSAGIKYQNPQVQFNFPGKYQVCLSTTNGVGKGATVCKKDYITVLPSINIGTAVVNYASGYLYDDGGQFSAYVNNGGSPSTLIAPCADSVYLVFTMFDLNCNISFMQLYEGTNAKGRRLDPCGGTGLNSGFTGGPTGASCGSPCMPNVTKPDTFKAAKSMFIQMNDGSASANAKGFAAYWWSKPSSSKKPKAAFTTNFPHDSVCVNAQVSFTNTTVNTNPLDPVTFLWDLDGDASSFECIGTCATATWPFFLTGPTNVTLIASNCGGSDTSVHTLTVYNPKAPKTVIKADNTNPTTADVVFFTAPIVQCIEDYKWTITKSAGSGTGTAKYVNGTSNIYPNPQVTFSDTGYYDVKLFVDNLNASQKDSLTIKKYIHVRNPYCIPSVALLNQGMGISKITLNTLSNSTTQALYEYSNFSSNLSLTTSLAQGATYPVTVSRNAALLFESLNRSVFIDWNQDGSFTGKGEEVAEDSNSFSVTWTGKITVPKTAKLGATVMRIAVNRGAYSNKPCGQNEFGEYQDYRIYITPYNIPPVITLIGHQGLTDTVKIEQGNKFTEPGYSASSFLYGNITKNVVRTSKKVGGTDSFNYLIPATYVFSYNVSDSAGNKAVTQYRVVVVKGDITPPVLIVDKPDTTILEVTATPIPFVAPKVISADDLVDGPLASSVINDANKVTSNIVGFYTITYTVSDLSGNTATVYRYVKVIDTIKPVITLLGANPATLEVRTSFNDPGVKISDNYDNVLSLNQHLIITSNLDSSKLGTYTITYDVTDKSGNKAITVTRTVKVVDSIKPAITLNGVQFDSVDVFTRYNDPGVTYFDNFNKTSELTPAVSGSFYTQFPGGIKPNKLGTYTIVYTVTDLSGNKASVTRNIKVVDHVAPVFVLNGPTTVTVCRWFNYADAGYVVSDNLDKSTDITVTTLSTGNTSVEGLFSIQYKGVDKSGNIGYSDYRYILVKEANSPSCTSSVQPGLSLDKYINVYPNPNTGIFTISASLPTREKVRISVTNMLGQEIAVIHNGILDTNNFQVDLTSQSSGIYMLNIVSNNQTLTKRIEITR
jgi:PKD repeat protein